MLELELGKRYSVKVLKIIRTGIVVQVGDIPSNTLLIHLSRISRMFVDDVSKFVKVGFTYEAEAITGKVLPIELSLQHLNLTPEGVVIGVDLARGPDKTGYISNRTRPVVKHQPAPTTLSLDDMINKMNKDYGDKAQTMKVRERKRGKR